MTNNVDASAPNRTRFCIAMMRWTILIDRFHISRSPAFTSMSFECKYAIANIWACVCIGLELFMFGPDAIQFNQCLLRLATRASRSSNLFRVRGNIRRFYLPVTVFTAEGEGDFRQLILINVWHSLWGAQRMSAKSSSVRRASDEHFMLCRVCFCNSKRSRTTQLHITNKNIHYVARIHHEPR